MRSRARTATLSRRLQMCAQAACCRSSRNCRRCGIALPNPGSGGTKFVSRSVPLRSSTKCRAGVLSEMASRVENRRSDCSLPVGFDEAFAPSPQSGLTWFCFLFLSSSHSSHPVRTTAARTVVNSCPAKRYTARCPPAACVTSCPRPCLSATPLTNSLRHARIPR
jgi:hypothetical protein